MKLFSRYLFIAFTTFLVLGDANAARCDGDRITPITGSPMDMLGRALFRGGVNPLLVTCEYLGTPYDLYKLVAHAGIDFRILTDPVPVYSVTDGEVVTAGGSSGQVSVKRGDGALVNYLHLSEITISKGPIFKGAQIGKTGWTGAYDSKGNPIHHLHIEVIKKEYSTGNPLASGDNLCGGWCSLETEAQMLMDPSLEMDTSLVPTSTVDGAGSLVDPNRGGKCNDLGGWGCYRDIVTLHHHDTPSTGLFQVLRESGKCDYVQLDGLKEAYVVVKGWDEHYPGEKNGDYFSTVYKATGLPADVPLVAKINSSWNLIAVTSTVPIPAGQTRDVTLTCMSGSPGQSLKVIAPDVSTRKNNPTLVLNPLPNNTYWSGNGSLMSFSNNRSIPATSQSEYGRKQDEVITLTTKNSLAIFQVYKSSSLGCRSVVIDTPPGTFSVVAAEISWKIWNAPNWLCGNLVSLPYTVDLPTDEHYWVIKIKTAGGMASSGAFITAKCAS